MASAPDRSTISRRFASILLACCVGGHTMARAAPIRRSAGARVGSLAGTRIVDPGAASSNINRNDTMSEPKGDLRHPVKPARSVLISRSSTSGHSR